MSANAQFSRVIAAQGAEFIGLQQGPRGMLVMFTDPVTRSTLALPEAELNAESLSRRLRESRERHAVGLRASQE